MKWYIESQHGFYFQEIHPQKDCHWVKEFKDRQRFNTPTDAINALASAKFSNGTQCKWECELYIFQEVN